FVGGIVMFRVAGWPLPTEVRVIVPALLKLLGAVTVAPPIVLSPSAVSDCAAAMLPLRVLPLSSSVKLAAPVEPAPIVSATLRSLRVGSVLEPPVKLKVPEVWLNEPFPVMAPPASVNVPLFIVMAPASAKTPPFWLNAWLPPLLIVNVLLAPIVRLPALLKGTEGL